MRKLILLVPFIITGCCSTPEPQAVKRERGMSNVWQKRALDYSKADPNLTAAQKQDDVDYWAAWESWLKDRESRVGK